MDEVAPCEGCYSEGDASQFCNTWRIEISSLEELMELVKTQGKIILSGDTITIYDYYVE